MKRKLTLLIVIILTSYSIYGQICGTTSAGAVSYSTEAATNTSFLNSSSSIYINVFFHIVRNNRNLQEVTNNLLHTHTIKTNINKKIETL